MKILFGSTKGASRALATGLAQRLTAHLPGAAAAAAAATESAACCGGGACQGGTTSQLGNGQDVAAAGDGGGGCCKSASSSGAGACGGAASTPSFSVSVCNVADYEPEGLLSEARDTLVILLVSTYEGGTPPESASFFCRWGVAPCSCGPGPGQLSHTQSSRSLSPLMEADAANPRCCSSAWCVTVS